MWGIIFLIVGILGGALSFLLLRSFGTQNYFDDLYRRVHELNLEDVEARHLDRRDARDYELLMLEQRHFHEMVYCFWRSRDSFMSDRMKALMQRETFELVEIGQHLGRNTVGIRCYFCGMTSFHPNDVINRFCGFCDRYHEAGKADQDFKEVV